GSKRDYDVGGDCCDFVEGEKYDEVDFGEVYFLIVNEWCDRIEGERDWCWKGGGCGVDVGGNGGDSEVWGCKIFWYD
ncbi:hypothetical protein, partial [Siminovitchia fortis]|uniref:hypothetical protein n=1 Tax=Siminovitchia fortis TaxID=254758 RepID=UPI001C92FE40